MGVGIARVDGVGVGIARVDVVGVGMARVDGMRVGLAGAGLEDLKRGVKVRAFVRHKSSRN